MNGLTPHGTRRLRRSTNYFHLRSCVAALSLVIVFASIETAGAQTTAPSTPLSRASISKTERPDAALFRKRVLEALDATHSERAFWGILVADRDTGATLYEMNADHFFLPASNAKLFTTAMALTRLGPDFVFRTRVVADGAPDAEGRIHGTLRLVGGGDPNLSARAVPYRLGPATGNPLAAIEDL